MPIKGPKLMPILDPKLAPNAFMSKMSKTLVKRTPE